MHIDLLYLFLIDDVQRRGDEIKTRNSVCRRIVAETQTFTSTPLVSVRKTAWKSALREFEWFMTGSDNIKDLHPSVHSWWQPWASVNGTIEHNYSRQFRHFHGDGGTVDQIQLLIDGIANHPFSRRNVITTWNTADMVSKNCPITNCHGSIIQAFVNPDRTLHLVTYQRSVDVICGLPHNWIQYWAFLLWLAARTGTTVGTLTWIGGDIHVYDVHRPLVDKMRNAYVSGETPTLVYTPTSLEFKADDFTLDGPYKPALTDRAEMVV